MPFTAPEADVTLAQQAPTAQPTTGGFTAPKTDIVSGADELANDDNFDPIQFALDNPEQVGLAKEVAWKKKQQPWTKERLQKLPGVAWEAGKGIVKDFGAGLGNIAADSYTQATDDTEANRDRAATQQVLRAQLVENNTETFFNKLFGPNTWLGKLFEGAGSNMAVGNALFTGGGATSGGMSLLEHSLAAQKESKEGIAERDKDPRGAFDNDFDYRLQLAGKERDILAGKVQDTGAVADAIQMGGDLAQRNEASKGGDVTDKVSRFFSENTEPAKPSEIFKSGEELAAAGAPVDSEAIRTGAVTADPMNLLPLQVPKVAPALNTVAGAALRLPKAIAGEIVERIPGSIKRKVVGGAATVGGGAITYDLYNDPEKALQRLGIAVGVGAGLGGAKLIGHILDNAGSKMMNPKFVSAAEREAAEAMMDINARGGGAVEKMTNKAMNVADAERMASRAVQGVASAPGGVLPMLPAMENPEEAASMVGGGMGFGALAGGTAYNPMKGFRPDIVQAVDTVLRDNGAKKTYGTELDAKHSAWMKNAPEWVRDGVNAYRGFFDGFKVGDKEPQIYVLNGADFAAEITKRRPDITADLAQNQRGFASKDGTILINGDYGGEAAGILGHEGTGHLATESIMRVLAPELTKSLQDAATKGLLNADGTPSPQLKRFIDAYNREFDPSGKTKEIETSEHAVSEWLAEQARSILDGDGGPAKYAAGESVREKIADNLGDYFKTVFGTKEAFDREQLPGIAGEYRNLLFEMGRFGNRARNGEDIYGTPTPEPATPADGGTPPVTTAKPATDAGRPVTTPARTPDQINGTARLGALAVDEASVDAARDKARQDAIDAEKQRRGKRPMSEKSEADVAEQAGKDFDAQLERYLAALEGEGVTHPEGMDVIEAIRLNELAPDSNLPRWKGWAGRPGDRPAAPRADRPDRVIEEPQEGESYPYQATPEEVAGLQERGWLPEEIAAMPQSQVEVELGTPAPAAEPAAVPAGTPATPGAQLSGIQPAGSPEAPAGSPSGALSGVAPAAAPETGARPGTPAATPGDRPAPVRVSVDQINQRVKAAEDAARKDEAGKKRKNEETRTKATDKAVKEARVRALADIATEDAAGDADLLQVRKDDKGRERITGKLDTSIESHRMLADEMGLTPEDIEIVNNFQNGKTLYVDYLSAKNAAPEDVTGKQRRKEYKANPPADRGDATGTLQKNKAILGVTFSVSKGGGAVIKGVSVDKFLSNAKKLLDFAKQNGIEVEYTDINDKRFLPDLQGYVQNHQNNWKGDGSGPIKGEQATPGYTPYVIPGGRFDLLNAAFHADVSTKVDSNRADTRQNAMDAQARALENNWKVDDASGDVNAFRAHINESGKLVFKNNKGEVRQGTGEVLETVWENLVPDMVLNVSEAPLGARDIVRDAGFTGDAGKVFEGGKLPNFKNVEAGFMPGRGKDGQLSDFGDSDESSIKSKVIETPQFKKWFGDSSVVDSEGNPLPVYHGTSAEFGEFRTQNKGVVDFGLLGTMETDRSGIFFAENKDFANTFAKSSESGRGGKGKVMEVFLSIKKPLLLDEGWSGLYWKDARKLEEAGIAEKYNLTKVGEHYSIEQKAWDLFDGDKGKEFVQDLKSLGYDGVLIKEEGEGLGDNADHQNVWVAFEPNQVKSATDNSGDFNPENPDIRFMPGRGNDGQLSDFGTSDESSIKSKVSGIDIEEKADGLIASSEKGYVGGHIKDGSLKIAASEISDPKNRGKGHGTALYKELINAAFDKGLKVFSDSTVEKSAVRVYESLERQGFEVIRNPNTKSLEDGALYVEGGHMSTPVFEVRAPAKGKGEGRFMYGGENARFFDEAEGNGKTFRGRYDGRQRFEIDDSPSKLLLKEDDTSVSRTLERVLDHPELFRQYPELRDLLTTIEIDPNAITSGKYIEGTPETATMFGRDPEISVTAPNLEEARKSLMHEIQHHLQKEEGFAKGGSPRDFESMDMSQVAASGRLADDYAKARPILEWLENNGKEFSEDSLKEYAKEHGRNVGDVIWEGMYGYDSIKERPRTVAELDAEIDHLREAGGRWMTDQTEAFDKYKSLAGEIESRDVENRIDMTAEERAKVPPYSSENIPREKATIKFMPGSGKKGQLADFGNKEANKNFKGWAGKSKVVRVGQGIDDVKPGAPVVIEGFHGTTHAFEVVDTSRANIENDMGRGFYVSNKPDDVSTNYAGEGPDLTARIERRAERIESELEGMEAEDIVSQFGVTPEQAQFLIDSEGYSYGSAQAEERTNLLNQLAKKELTSHGGATMKVFVKMEKPLKIGGKEEYWDSEYNDETGEASGKVMEFIESLRDVAADYGEDIDTSPLDEFTYEGTTPSEAIRAAKEIVGEISDPDTGDLAGNEIIRAAIERMGYDGIIDASVNEKFGTKRKFGKPMEGIDESTFHVIAFKPEQVKSATGNAGTFDPNSPNMNLMPGSKPRRTWFVRDGKRVTAARQDDGKFAAKKPSLANVAPLGVASRADDRNRKQLETFK